MTHGGVSHFQPADSETPKLDAATAPLPVAEQYWGIYEEAARLLQLPWGRLFG